MSAGDEDAVDVRARCRGALLGLAAGDRIGGPTVLAMRLAASLLQRRGLDLTDVAARYLDWWRAGAFDAGPTFTEVFALVARGTPPQEAARRVHDRRAGLTAGCNPAHRIASLAMAACVPDHALADSARAEAALTHAHPLAGDASAAMAVLCRGLIRGSSWQEAVLLAVSACQEPETHEALVAGQHSLGERDPSGYSPSVLRAAVFFVADSTAVRAGDALSRAVNFAGAANYCPVLVGSLLGARWGADAIPTRLLDSHPRRAGLSTKEELFAAADHLAAGWSAAVR